MVMRKRMRNNVTFLRMSWICVIYRSTGLLINYISFICIKALDTTVKKIRMVCELVILIWSIIYLAIAIRERSFLGGQIFKENMVLCPSRVLFLLACFLVVLCVPLR